MTTTLTDPPVRHLVLGANLAHLRTRCAVSPVHAAAAARAGTDELFRWESGQAPPPEQALQHLMHLYNQPPELFEVLARWATTTGEDSTPHALLDTAAGWQARLSATELHAVRVRAFSNYSVPALVRSRAYADHLERMRSGVLPGLAAEQRWPRPVVTGPHSWKHVDIILDASVLTRPFDVEAGNLEPLADQLKHLVKVAYGELADIRIISTATDYSVDVGDGDLLGLTLPAPPSPTVWVQVTRGSVTYLNGPQGQDHLAAFEKLSRRAETRPASAVLLHEAAARTAREGAEK
ncbi:Scr1 family TA system antitoxin-like transcriptional regulator [Streptomyces sp. TLI_146]|uniref:Scr1 family TA system antitoxin-like transcriptional regulator n=1 Tax=Streptomyces sp. TLI_146 TaxID=1938858 RepID=UPI000C7130EA|nr:Scr1 family TA system antitoxin-like transcriptional regulator [Streptomyces sp. TLI_146]PKV82694.1 helix-turn-helix protein [Streptomyces sp. TLI_146]